MRFDSGRTLIEALIASALAVFLIGVTMPTSVSSVNNFHTAERRQSGRSDLRRALMDIERALRSTDRDANFGVRPMPTSPPVSPDPTAPFNGVDESGGSLYLSQFSSFDAATRSPIYGNAVCYYVGRDTQNGGYSLYKLTWTGTTDVALPPTRTERIAVGVSPNSLVPFTDGPTTRVFLQLRRRDTDGKDFDVGDAIEVHINEFSQ